MNFPLESTYFVVTDTGVKGRYNDLDLAKQVLKGFKNGNRLIAEVNGTGILNRDPQVISGQKQTKPSGFNWDWCGWSCIDTLMNKAQEYLQEHSTG